MKVLIVDDEPHCRATIRNLLRGTPGIDGILEAGDGEQALEIIGAENPGLVFLDVQMPRLSGLEVAAEMPAERNPLIIFVTAHDEHAVRAFELHAADYLLKPFTDSRFADCVAHAMRRISPGTEQSETQSGEPGTSRAVQVPAPLVVKSGGDLVFIQPSKIRWVEGQGDYLKIHTEQGSVLIRDTFKGLLERLGSKGLLRIHKSMLINPTKVRRMTPIQSGDYSLELDDGTVLRASRSYRDEFRILLGQIL